MWRQTFHQNCNWLHTIASLAKYGAVKALLLSVFWLTACGDLTGRQTDIHRQETLRGQLVLWARTNELWTESILARFKKEVGEIVVDFTDLYQDVEIVIEFMQEDRLLEEFMTQVNRGFGPDLVLTGARDILVLGQAGVLQDLSDYGSELSSFRAEALSQVHFQGKIYGWPTFLHTQVLCYNKAKVKTLPTTLKELRLQALTGYSVGMVSDFSQTFWGTQIFGGKLFDPKGRVVLERDRGWAKWMEWLKEAKDEPNFILSPDAPALQEAFIEGRLAYIVCNSIWIPPFRQALGNRQLGVALLPGDANQPAGPFLEPSVLLFNRVSNRNQTQLALKFAKYLTNEAQQREMATNLPAFIPVNTQVQIDRRLFPIQGVLQKQSRTGVTTPLNTHHDIEDFYRYANTLYQKVLAGEMPADEAAEQLAERFNSALNEP